MDICDLPHAATAASVGSFEYDGQSVLFTELVGFLGRSDRAITTGYDLHTCEQSVKIIRTLSN